MDWDWKRDWPTAVLAVYGVLMLLRDALRLAGWL